MSKIQMLMSKIKGPQTVFNHVTNEGVSYDYKRTLTILEDWALNTMVCFQITALLKEAVQKLQAVCQIPDFEIDLNTCRFQMIDHGWWPSDKRYLSNGKHGTCLRVRLYPIATQDDILNQKDSTYIEVNFCVINNRITTGYVYNQQIARCDEIYDTERESHDDWMMALDHWDQH